MSGEQRSGTGLVLLLALPAIFATVWLTFAVIVRLPQDNAAFALLILAPLLLVTAIYFVIDRAFIKQSVGASIVRSLIILLVAFLGLAVEIPSELTIAQRMHQKETMQRMRTIAAALRAYASTHHGFPVTDNVAAAGANLPREDGWMHPFALRSRADSYFLMSYGSHGEPDVASPEKYPAGPTTRFEDDIVMRNGEFIRYPEGLQ